MAQDRSISTSLLKALDLIALLSVRPDGASINELAAATRVPRTTAARIVNTLAARGLVERADGAVRITPAFRRLAKGDRYDELRRRYRPILEAVSAKVKELVLLGVREGRTLVHLDFVEWDHAVRVAPAPTTHHDLRTGAQGKLLLSRFPDLVAAERSVKLRRELEEVARTRVAWNHEETRPGVVAVACPGLVDAGDEPVLAVAWPRMRFTPDKGRRAVAALRGQVRRHRGLGA
ncbi:MAG: helix-turn-helix domain-containing protein [Planctomycetota bacterium]